MAKPSGSPGPPIHLPQPREHGQAPRDPQFSPLGPPDQTPMTHKVRLPISGPQTPQYHLPGEPSTPPGAPVHPQNAWSGPLGPLNTAPRAPAQTLSIRTPVPPKPTPRRICPDPQHPQTPQFRPSISEPPFQDPWDLENVARVAQTALHHLARTPKQSPQPPNSDPPTESPHVKTPSPRTV